MLESFEKQELKVRKCLKYEDFDKMPGSARPDHYANTYQLAKKQQVGAITITIHKALAQFVYYGHSDKLFQYYTFVDEVDRFSEHSPLGFKGSKDVMKLVHFFYGTSADELTPEDKGPNGLDCPPATEFIKVGNRCKNVKVMKITESGDKLYEKLGTMAKDNKLLLCVKDKVNMIACKDQMIKHGKIAKDRIITFDPETTHHQSKQNWAKVAKLMKEPALLDVVVTWAGGNRSHNYFPSCLPVAMFQFEHEKELHQLAGRSERMDNEDKEFIVACVENEIAEKEAAKVKDEDEEMVESDHDNQIKDATRPESQTPRLCKRTRANTNTSAHDNTNKKQKVNE